MNVQTFTDQFEQFGMPIKGVRLPVIPVDAKYKKALRLTDDCSNSEFLRALCKQGFLNLKLRKGSKEYEEYGKRIKYELETINDLGFVDYILLVWDVVNFCKENDIPIGAGRGSAAGSLLLHLIGITRIDPIKYGLYFERFLSPSRAKKTIIDGVTYFDGSLVPDIDIDFDFYKRHKIIEYLNQKYAGKICKILTLTTLASKLVIKEVGKVLGMKSEDEMKVVTNLIPDLHGKVYEIEEAYEEVADFKTWCDNNPLIYNAIFKLKNLVKNTGVHASGIAISYDPLEECCPTQLTSDKEEVSGYSMDWVAAFAIKLDALGLRNVSVIDDCCKSIGIKAEDIDINDPLIYQSLFDLKYPHGIFQIETDSGFRICKKVKPKNLNELSAIMAINRPGAMQFVEKYAKYTNTGTYESIHPFFDDVLRETGSTCLYQEQMLKMVHKLGFTLDEAETVRRIVGKKKVAEMAMWEKKIYDKCKERGLDEEVGKILWKIMDDSKAYSFNASHSFSYGSIAAQTAYLKFKYPLQFFLSLLKMTKHEADSIGQIAIISKEMGAFGLKLLPPSLTESQIDFAVENGNIRFGLSSIKGVSDKTIEKLNDFKKNFVNKFEIFESAKKAGLTIGVLSALIQAGTLDKVSDDRVLLVYEAQLWNILKDKEKKYVLTYAPQYNNSVAKTVKALVEIVKDEKGKPIIKESRLKTITKDSLKYKLIYEQNRNQHAFANWWYEHKLLGYTSDKKLFDIFNAKYLQSKRKSLKSLSEIKELAVESKASFIGIIDELIKVGKSKNGNNYAKFLVSDESGAMQVMIFNDHLDDCKVINTRLPKEADIVICEGTRKEDNMFFADNISVQQNIIYTKLADLKDKGGSSAVSDTTI